MSHFAHNRPCCIKLELITCGGAIVAPFRQIDAETLGCLINVIAMRHDNGDDKFVSALRPQRGLLILHIVHDSAIGRLHSLRVQLRGLGYCIFVIHEVELFPAFLLPLSVHTIEA